MSKTGLISVKVFIQHTMGLRMSWMPREAKNIFWIKIQVCTLGFMNIL